MLIKLTGVNKVIKPNESLAFIIETIHLSGILCVAGRLLKVARADFELHRETVAIKSIQPGYTHTHSLSLSERGGVVNLLQLQRTIYIFSEAECGGGEMPY